MSNIERSKGDTWRVVAKGFLVGLVNKECYFLWSENIFASFTGSQCAWGMSMSMVASPLKEPAQSELWASYNSSSPPFFTTSAQRCRIMGWYKCDQPTCFQPQFKEFSFHPRINQNLIYVSRGEIITMAGSFFNWNVMPMWTTIKHPHFKFS